MEALVPTEMYHLPEYKLAYPKHYYLRYIYILNIHKVDAALIIYCVCIYRMSQEECARLREGVPYVKVYRYNPKHLYTKLNGYGDNGQRKVGASCGSKYCNLHS